MVKINRTTILTVMLLSGAATAFLIISYATEHWVTATGKFISDETIATIKYGLFSGTFSSLEEEPTYELKMTCLISDNACAYLCEISPELRKIELEKLTKGENVEFNKNCPHVLQQGVKSLGLNYYKQYKVNGKKREFLNAGLYISTNLFLGISVLFGFFATVFPIWILASNPTDVSLSIYAVYTYNIVACVSSLVTLIVWAVLFRINIIYNIGILYTIQGQMDTSGVVNLGFSYWLILFSCVFYLINCVLVHVRQYPISRKPDTKSLISE